MAKKKKNKALPLIILMSAAIVLVGAYVAIDRLDLNADDDDDSSVITVLSRSSDDIAGARFTDENGETVTLRKENNRWSLEEDPDFPVNGTDAESIATSCLTLLATREITDESHDYGFDSPQNVITLYFTDDDGESSVTFTVGVSNSFNGGTYVRDDTNNKIYICSTNPASKFNIARDDLIELDTHAYDVDPLSVKAVTLNSLDGRTITITDDDGMEEFISTPFDLIDCADWVEYAADDEKMLEYGIVKSDDSPGIIVNYKNSVSVTDSDGESSTIRQDAVYNLWFGNTLEDGSVYYSITGSTIVYKTTKEIYDTIMEYLDYVPAPDTETTAVSE